MSNGVGLLLIRVEVMERPPLEQKPPARRRLARQGEHYRWEPVQIYT